MKLRGDIFPIIFWISGIITLSSASPKYDYTELLKKSILFYEAQRSGTLKSSNRVPWRGDSALRDKGTHNEDLTGGWYDAGDTIKFGFPMASATTLLVWGLLEWTDAYRNTRQLGYMLDCIKWPLDYFIKAHSSNKELYVQVGKAQTDHEIWTRPEDDSSPRSAYKISPRFPGSDVAGETSAAMAAGYIAFKGIDLLYANNLLRHSIQLYKFAIKYKGKYSRSVPQAAPYYRSSGYRDELAWAALWLYQATKRMKYLRDAEAWYVTDVPWALSWDEKLPAVQVLLYKFTKKKVYEEDLKDFLKSWMPGGTVQYTPKGLAWRFKWGPLRYSANSALIALMAAELGLNAKRNRKWAQGQIHYMLGDSGRSFVVGYGNNPPKRPHHRASSCPSPPRNCSWDEFESKSANPHTLNGALVGGPALDDSYFDERENYWQNEVACDYNAGFQSVVAGLKHLELIKKSP